MRSVVPLVGTWIEILFVSPFAYLYAVVPLVGTWIEIPDPRISSIPSCRRSPCGNVD